MTSALVTASGHAFPEAARQLFGNVRLQFPDGMQDRSRLQSMMLGSCRLSRLEAERHRVSGERVVTGSDCPDSVKLIVQSAGQSILSQGGRQAVVGGERILLYDPTRPYLLENRTAVRLLLLQLPRAALGSALLRRLREPFPMPARAAGLSSILTSMMASTLDEAPRLDAAMRRAVGDTMIDLVRSLAGGQGDEATSPLPPLDMLMSRVTAYVEDNLADPDLDVQAIARRMGCSPRYVYRAFERQETTPGDFIWARRLERAAEDLRRVPDRPGVISAIAFGLGFSSSAHFARAFKARFGVTPSDWRRTVRV